MRTKRGCEINENGKIELKKILKKLKNFETYRKKEKKNEKIDFENEKMILKDYFKNEKMMGETRK